MLRIVVDKYAVLSAFQQEICKVITILNNLIYGIFQLCFPAQTLPCHIPFPMRLTFCRIGVANDRQIMLPANLIRYITELFPRTFFDLALIVQSLESMTVNQVRIIEHTMQVRVLFINVDCQQKLVLIVQKFRADLLADFQRTFGGDLTGLEADDKVLCEDGASA